MLKVLIQESDVMFRSGMKYFLSDLFYQRFNLQVGFMIDYTSENIYEADVIVISMCQGESYTCFPELRARRKGIIIGVLDGNDFHEHSPSCFSDIIYITRCEPLIRITHKITLSWLKWLVSESFPEYKSCHGCNHINLSLSQREIMVRLYMGRSVQQVATEMNVTYKTIAAHKYFVMRKFNLKNDYQLFRFLGMLRQKCATHLFL